MTSEEPRKAFDSEDSEQAHSFSAPEQEDRSASKSRTHQEDSHQAKRASSHPQGSESAESAEEGAHARLDDQDGLGLAESMQPSGAEADNASQDPSNSSSSASSGARPSISRDAKPSKRVRRMMTFRTRMVLNFMLVSLLTAGIALGMIVFVWGEYFNTYSAKNTENIIGYAANRLASDYAEDGDISSDAISNTMEMLSSFRDLRILVQDNQGNTVFSNIDATGSGSEDDDQADSLDNATFMKLANASLNGMRVGTVRIWVGDPELLMNEVDREFRNSTILSVVVAGIVAIVLASLLALLFVHGLVGPISQITKAAQAISEGDYTARTNLVGNDEIAKLGETFDEMATRLEDEQRMERQLTSDVAHELRTPIMAIQSTLEAMIDGVYETDIAHLSIVNIEAQRLSRLVNALLRLSRLENRTTVFNEEVTDISELLEEILFVHEALIEDSSLKLKAKIQRGIMVVCDRDQIRQAIVNLLSNAVRYTPEGGRITVDLHRVDDMVEIKVSDTGIGLSPEEAKKVFGRFWRADAGRKHESGGLGIGLAVVKEIVEQHHGAVMATGVKGEGATFTILLPAYNEREARRQAKAALSAFQKRNNM